MACSPAPTVGTVPVPVFPDFASQEDMGFWRKMLLNVFHAQGKRKKLHAGPAETTSAIYKPTITKDESLTT
jgi:hypothetical protein